MNEAYELAHKVLKENRKLLDTIADYLMKVETLTKQDIDEIVKTGGLSRYDKNNGLVEEEVEEAKQEEKTNDETW